MYKPVQKTCEYCKKIYIGNPYSKYCGYDCSHASRKRRIKLICQECGKSFERQNWNSDAKFCSYECKTKSQSSDMLTLTCTNCSKVFKRNASKVHKNKSGHSFCCKKCADNFNSGSNHYEWKEHLHDKNKKTALQSRKT